ncbi:MAG: GHKL domain-containing protein [Dorea sp.]|jgi:hypothetical protein|nr:GHKL domain-containing protein [Dorea sp.]
MNVWELLQAVVTAFETGMCVWLCDTLIYNGEFVRERKGYAVGSILLLTVFVLGNRQYTFFSWPILFAQTFLVWFLFLGRKWKCRTLCFLVVFNYYLLITLLDLVFSFLAVSYLDNNFWSELYYEVGQERLLLYSVSRCIMFGVCLSLWACRKKYRFCIEEYKGVLFSVGIVGTIWGWLLLKTLERQGTYMGLEDSFQVVTCLLILLALMAIELRSTYIKAESKIIQMKNELLEQNHRDMQKQYKNSQYIFHDFKNHLILLKNYVDRKEYEKLSAYLGRIMEPIESLDNFSYTGSEMLDLVLNIKRSEAVQKGIQYLVETDRNIELNINENALGNIFFNLLDNAIEACEKIVGLDRWIRIVIKKNNQVYIMKVENSIAEPVTIQDGEYMSGKKDKEQHGIGMKSVKATVEQYGGEVQWNHTKEKFTVVITFFGNGL